MKNSQNKIFLIFSLVALICLAGCVTSSPTASKNLTIVQSFEGGELYRTNGDGGSGTFDVLNLRGDWREMGRQYGYLTRDKLKEVYNSTTEYLAAKGATPEKIAETAEQIYQSHLDYAKELTVGMAETSGMSLENQKIANAGLLLVTLAGCSSLDAWGDYTGGGPLVVGRNWDIGAHMNPFNRFLTVAVYHPTGSAIPVADINYLGWFQFQSGMNKSGIFLDLQNGSLSDASPLPEAPNPNDTLFNFLLDSSTLKQLDEKFLANRPMAGLVMNAADSKQGQVYEWATHGTKIRQGDGLIASTNHFIDPNWEVALPAIPDGEPGAFSKDRLANLLAQGEIYKGKINVAVMQEIFGKTIEQGGPTFPGGKTTYQIIAVPADRTVWLKGTDYSGWEKIELAPLF